MKIDNVHKPIGKGKSERLKKLFDDDEPSAGNKSRPVTSGKASYVGKGSGSGTWSKGSQTSYAPAKRCAHSPPPLPLGKNDKGEEMYVYGGACSSIVVPNLDISIGLDYGFKPLGVDGGMAPWDGKIEFLYEIQDMGVPKNLTSFKKLLEFMEASIRAGKKVHIGCIGGHGRTGTVLAALVSRMLPDVKDAIGYVREKYCVKAVESAEQVKWLNKHFGVAVVKGYKEGTSYSSGPTSYASSSIKGYKAPVGSSGRTTPLAGVTATALPGPDCIWYRKPLAPK